MTFIIILLIVIICFVCFAYTDDKPKPDYSSSDTRKEVVQDSGDLELSDYTGYISYDTEEDDEIIIDEPYVYEENESDDYEEEFYYEYEDSSYSPEEIIYEYRDPYEVVEEAIWNREDHVCLVDEEITDIYWRDVFVMPYGSFWVEWITSTEEYYLDGHTYKDIYFGYYDLSEDEIESMMDEIDEAADAIISQIPDDASIYEKCLMVHDALIECTSFDWTYTEPHRHDLYGALVNHIGVCSGYSSAYYFILDELGIPCQIVDSGTHSWNMVGSNNVDCCWDDYDVVDSEGNTIISYFFFGIGDQINQIEDHEIVGYSYNWNDSDYTLPYYFEDYTLSEYSYDALVDIMTDQIDRGVVMPTVLFTNESAYEDCKEAMESDYWNLISDTGYDGPANSIYANDEYLTWGFN